jgi:hypothetical protein
VRVRAQAAAERYRSKARRPTSATGSYIEDLLVEAEAWRRRRAPVIVVAVRAARRAAAAAAAASGGAAGGV